MEAAILSKRPDVGWGLLSGSVSDADYIHGRKVGDCRNVRARFTPSYPIHDLGTETDEAMSFARPNVLLRRDITWMGTRLR